MGSALAGCQDPEMIDSIPEETCFQPADDAGTLWILCLDAATAPDAPASDAGDASAE